MAMGKGRDKQGRLPVHVALADVGEAPDERGRHDRRQRGALGHDLGGPKGDRQDRDEGQPAADAYGSAEQTGDEAAHDRPGIEPVHGRTIWRMPTNTITAATT